MSFLQLQHIHKSYGHQKVLDDIHILIEKGDFITLLGPSGCGKSTLLRCIAGLEQMNAGEVVLEGNVINHILPRKRKMGMIFQQYSLFPTMTVFKNIVFGLSQQKLTKKELVHTITKALDIVELRGYEKKYPSQLSGGEKQRVAIARSLVTNPVVMLYDEPFSAIDAKLRKELQLRIKTIHSEMKMTSIFVTHDQEEAMILSDRIFIMNKGKVIQSDTPINIYNAPADYFAAQFIGDYNLIPQDVFYRVFNMKAESSFAAIRPELLTMKKPDAAAIETNTYQGQICDIIPHGNFIQYIVQVNGYPLKVNLLNSKEQQFQKEEHVDINFDHANILHLS